MRRYGLLLILGVALISASLSAGSAAVGTVTVVRTRIFGEFVINQYALSWTSSAGGAVSANPFSVVPGDILRVQCVPGSGGTQPTDLYDMKLTDIYGFDIVDGQGSDLRNVVPDAGDPGNMQFTTPYYFPGSTSHTLDLVIANAGNAKNGVCTLWIR